MTHTDFHIHHDAPEVVGRRERLGVRLLIVADGAFLFGMIFSYFYLRNLNTNNGWFPHGAHRFSAASGWVVALPFIVAAISHRIGLVQRALARTTTVVTLLALLVGLYLQWHQLAHMPFIIHDEGGGFSFTGGYASSWVLLAGANLFHYILGGFIALGLVLRHGRTQVDPTLELWRGRTAGSWFTWIAVAAIASALVTSIV